MAFGASTFTATPFSTVICMAQVSGQSCGQAARTTRRSKDFSTGACMR